MVQIRGGIGFWWTFSRFSNVFSKILNISIPLLNISNAMVLVHGEIGL